MAAYGAFPGASPVMQHAQPIQYQRAASPQPQQPIQPGSITYTTTVGQDGQVTYHPFRAVAASYQTPQGIVSGIQWVPAEATQVMPTGAVPANADFVASFNRPTTDDRALRDWQREDERRRRKEDKERSKAWERERRERERASDRDYRRADEKELRRMERDERDRRKGGGNPYDNYGVSDIDRRFQELDLDRKDREYEKARPRRNSGYDPAGPAAAYQVAPGGNYPGAAPYPPGSPYSTTSTVGGYAAGAYSTTSTVYGAPGGGRPPSPYHPGAAPRPVSPYQAGAIPPRSASPYQPGAVPRTVSPYHGATVAPRPVSPYHGVAPTARSTSPYYGPAQPVRSASPYHGVGPAPRSASPYHGAVPRSTSPYHGVPPRSASPYGGPPPVYPPGHVMEGRPIPGGFAIGSSYAGASPRMPTAVPGDPTQPMLAAPEGFSRPPNSAQSYTQFETMKVQDMDDFFENIPRMPLVLVPHDVYHEDWIRLMTDISLAWSGKLPVPEYAQDGRAPKRTVLTSDLIELWNGSFFLKRGVELVLYKGRERRSGRGLGSVDLHLPGFEDYGGHPSESEEESDDSDDDDDLGDDRSKYGAYGGVYGRLAEGQMAELQEARRARRDAKRADKKRRRQEKRHRRKLREAERKYALYLTCVNPREVGYGL